MLKEFIKSWMDDRESNNISLDIFNLMRFSSSIIQGGGLKAWSGTMDINCVDTFLRG